MISLIKNEITKIFKKKSIYVMLIVTLGFTILTNVIYKYIYNMNTDFVSEGYIKSLEEAQKNLDPNNPEEVGSYVSNQTELESFKLAKQYDKDSWQYRIAIEYGREYISNLNYEKYQNHNEEELAKVQAEYDEFIRRLKEDDWRKFAEEELENAKQNAVFMQDSDMTNIELEKAQMRLDYNIEYGDNYKNMALSRYSSSKMQVEYYEQETENKTYREQKAYQDEKEDMEKALYAIKNDKDILNTSNLRGSLLNMFSSYELFIIITVVLMGGGMGVVVRG